MFSFCQSLVEESKIDIDDFCKLLPYFKLLQIQTLSRIYKDRKNPATDVILGHCVRVLLWVWLWQACVITKSGESLPFYFPDRGRQIYAEWSVLVVVLFFIACIVLYERFFFVFPCKSKQFSFNSIKRNEKGGYVSGFNQRKLFLDKI